MKLTEAEWQIMNCLWESYPATAREVLNRLGGDVGWAYTTIKTMFSRLVDKGVVKEKKKGNVGVYEPILTRDRARKSALKSLANQAFDGAFGPLMHFLVEQQRLSGKQKKELVEMLGNKKQNSGVRIQKSKGRTQDSEVRIQRAGGKSNLKRRTNKERGRK